MNELRELYLRWKKRTKGTQQTLSERSGVPIASLKRAIGPIARNINTQSYFAIKAILDDDLRSAPSGTLQDDASAASGETIDAMVDALRLHWSFKHMYTQRHPVAFSGNLGAREFHDLARTLYRLHRESPEAHRDLVREFAELTHRVYRSWAALEQSEEALAHLSEKMRKRTLPEIFPEETIAPFKAAEEPPDYSVR